MGKKDRTAAVLQAELCDWVGGCFPDVLPLRSPHPHHAEELLIAAGEGKDHKRETRVKKKKKKFTPFLRERGRGERSGGRMGGEEQRKEGAGEEV